MNDTGSFVAAVLRELAASTAVILAADTGTRAAPQVVLNAVSYDASTPAVTVTNCAPGWCRTTGSSTSPRCSRSRRSYSACSTA